MVTIIFCIVLDVLWVVITVVCFPFLDTFYQFLIFLFVELILVEKIVKIITVAPQETADGCFGNPRLCRL